jgi:hypothetical protein
MFELNETIHQTVRLRIMASLVTLASFGGNRRQPWRTPAQAGRCRIHRGQQGFYRPQAAHLRLCNRRGTQGLPRTRGGIGIDLERQVR